MKKSAIFLFSGSCQPSGCAMDLDTDLAKRPAAQQLRTSLLDYVASDKFEPRHELSLEVLNNILITE